MSGPELNVQLGEVGKRIMEQRKRMGLTQKELAEKIGHTTQYVSYMETGKRTINWENIVRMASVFGVSVDYILTGNVVDKDRLLLAEKLEKLTATEMRMVEGIIDECIALNHQNKYESIGILYTYSKLYAHIIRTPVFNINTCSCRFQGKYSCNVDKS